MLPTTLCIFGLGYTARFLAAHSQNAGFHIIATSRDPERRQHYEKSGYQMLDFSVPAVCKIMPAVTHLLITIPPSAKEGELSLNLLQQTALSHFPALRSIVYLSSTGVYGDHQGAWVDESSPPQDTDLLAELRLAAEQQWTAFAAQIKVPLYILRVAGIYGPERNALVQLKNTKKYSIYKEGQVFSRIHVEDLALIIHTALQHPETAGIYNVCDDEPAPSHLVDRYAADLLKQEPLPLIPFEEASLSSMSKHFYSNNRRVSNQKLKEVLKIKLRYPSYREGLRKLAEDW